MKWKTEKRHDIFVVLKDNLASTSSRAFPSANLPSEDKRSITFWRERVSNAAIRRPTARSSAKSPPCRRYRHQMSLRAPIFDPSSLLHFTQAVSVKGTAVRLFSSPELGWLRLCSLFRNVAVSASEMFMIDLILMKFIIWVSQFILCGYAARNTGLSQVSLSFCCV